MMTSLVPGLLWVEKRIREIWITDFRREELLEAEGDPEVQRRLGERI